MDFDYKWVSGYTGIDWKTFDPKKHLVNHI